MASELLGSIADTSNLNFFPKLNSRFLHTQIHFKPSSFKVFPCSVKYFPSLQFMKPESGSHFWLFPFLPLHLQYSFKFYQLCLRMYLLHHLRRGHNHPIACAHCKSFQQCLSLIHVTFTSATGSVKVNHASSQLKTIWWHSSAIKIISNESSWPAPLYMCSCPFSK